MLLSSTFVVFPQEFKKEGLIREVTEYFDGDINKPKVITYRNNDLKVELIENYSENTEIISSIRFDPITGKKNDKFFFVPSFRFLKQKKDDNRIYSKEELDDSNNYKDINNHVNKGYYNQGLLNCSDFEILIERSWTDRPNYLLKGRVVDGHFDGDVEIYSLVFETKLEKGYVTNYKVFSRNGIIYGFIPSTELGTYETITGNYKKSKRVSSIRFNNGVVVDGDYILDEDVKLSYKGGVLNGVIRYNSENRTISSDSIYRDNKIWKIDNKFIKNKGWITIGKNYID